MAGVVGSQNLVTGEVWFEGKLCKFRRGGPIPNPQSKIPLPQAFIPTFPIISFRNK
jgi:hypothetical protein